MPATIEHISFLDEPAIKIENEYVEVIVVPGWGSSVLSLKDKVKNIQLIRSPQSREAFEAKPVLYGTPILFPPNRISDGTFSFRGKEYHFDINEEDKHNHIHGFVYDKKWEVVSAVTSDQQASVQTEFNAANYPEVNRQFPHDFKIRLTLRLEGNTLHKNATIINAGKESFPWGLGYHTTFMYPFSADGSLNQCTFSLTADKKWTLNERSVPTGELKDLENRDQLQQGMSLEGHILDDVFLSSITQGGNREAIEKKLATEEKQETELNQANQAVLSDEQAGLKLIYRCDDNMKHWVIFNQDGKQGFLCPEPYTWVTNAPNLDLPDSLTGVQVLGPGEEKTVKTEINIQHTD